MRKYTSIKSEANRNVGKKTMRKKQGIKTEAGLNVKFVIAEIFQPK